MKNLNTLQKALIAGVVVAAFGLAGCEADGNGLESGGIIGDGSDNGGLGDNDGSTPTTVNEDLDDDGNAKNVKTGKTTGSAGLRKTLTRLAGARWHKIKNAI